MADKRNNKNNYGNNSGKNHSSGSNSSKNHSSGHNSGKNHSGKNSQYGSGANNSRPNSNRNQSPKDSGKAVKSQKEEEVLIPVTEEEADEIRVTVNMDDGQPVECMILTILEGPQHDYVVLLPVDENDQPNADGEVYLYRYVEDEQGLPDIENILDDDEYEIAADLFDQWQDEQMFDEMDD